MSREKTTVVIDSFNRQDMSNEIKKRVKYTSYF